MKRVILSFQSFFIGVDCLFITHFIFTCDILFSRNDNRNWAIFKFVTSYQTECDFYYVDNAIL